MARSRSPKLGIQGVFVLALLLATDSVLSSDAVESEPGDGKVCKDSDAVCVAIRVRPEESQEEIKEGLVKCENSEHQECQEGITRKGHIHVEHSDGKSKDYGFDGIFSRASNTEVYESIAQPLLPKFLDENMNVAFLAYGATGSGKTYTMGFDGGDGILQKFLKGVYARADPSTLEIRVLEAYGEGNNEIGDLRNLMDPKKDQIESYLMAEGGFSQAPKTSDEAIERVKKALERRTTADTSLNNRSSRSHCIIQIRHKRGKNKNGELLYATATMVDLAGNEDPNSVEKAKRKNGANEQEILLAKAQGIHINLSLSNLSACIISLGNTGGVCRGERALTKALKEVLFKKKGGKAMSMIRVIGTVRQEDAMRATTEQTLRYLNDFKKLQVSAAPPPPAAADINTLKLALAEKQKELEIMREQLKEAKELGDTARAQKEAFLNENESLQNKIAALGTRPETAESGTSTEPLAEKKDFGVGPDAPMITAESGTSTEPLAEKKEFGVGPDAPMITADSGTSTEPLAQKKEFGVGPDAPMTTSAGTETEMSSDDLDQLQREFETKVNEKEYLLKQIEEMRNENALLVEHLQKSREDADAMIQQMDDLIKDKEKLTGNSVSVNTDTVESREMDVQTDAPAESGEMETQTDETDSEVEEELLRVRNELQSAHAETVDALQNLSSVQSENKKLMQDLEDAQRHYLEGLSDIEAKRDAVAAQLRDAQEMQERSQRLQQELQEELQMKLKKANDVAEDAVKELAEMKIEVETLKQLLAAKEDELRELKRNSGSGTIVHEQPGFSIKTAMTAVGLAVSVALGFGAHFTSSVPGLRGVGDGAVATRAATTAAIANPLSGLAGFPDKKGLSSEVQAATERSTEWIEEFRARMESLTGIISNNGEKEIARSEAMHDTVREMAAEITELHGAVERLSEQKAELERDGSVRPPVSANDDVSEGSSELDPSEPASEDDTPSGKDNSKLADTSRDSSGNDVSEDRDTPVGVVSRPHDGVTVHNVARTILAPRERQALVEYPFHTTFDPDAHYEPVKDIDKIKERYFLRDPHDNPFYHEYDSSGTSKGVVRSDIVNNWKEKGYFDIWDEFNPKYNNPETVNARIKWHIDRNLPHGVGYLGKNRMAIMRGEDPVDIYNKGEGDSYNKNLRSDPRDPAKWHAVLAANRDAERYVMDPHGPGDNKKHHSSSDSQEYREARFLLPGAPDGMHDQHRGFGDLIWPGSDYEKTVVNTAKLRGQDPSELKYVPGTKYQEVYDTGDSEADI